MNLDVSMGIVGLLISLVYVAVTVLGLGILVVGLIVLVKVNRLLTVRLRETTAVPVAGEPPLRLYPGQQGAGRRALNARIGGAHHAADLWRGQRARHVRRDRHRPREIEQLDPR